MNQSNDREFDTAFDVVTNCVRFISWVGGLALLVVFIVIGFPKEDQSVTESKFVAAELEEAENILGTSDFFDNQLGNPTRAQGPSAEDIAQQRLQATPEQLNRLSVEHWINGDTEPEFVAAKEAVRAFGSKRVIGFEIDGSTYAFATSGMMRPLNSLVTFERGQHRITIIYSCCFDLARVLVSDSPEKQHRVGLAGLTQVGEALVSVNGECFFLDNGSLPIPDISFAKTTLENWCQMHPNSRLYLGGLLSA